MAKLYIPGGIKLKYGHLKINHFHYYILLPNYFVKLQFWQMTVEIMNNHSNFVKATKQTKIHD